MKKRKNIMFNLKSTKQTIINFCLLAAVSLFAAQIISAQIIIGGIKIPKPKRPDKPNTNQTENKTESKTSGGGESNKQEDVQTNPKAPADYNANLNVGDQAIAVDHFRDISAVKILAKTSTAYKTAKIKEPDAIQWYSFNSVYPYYDTTAFDDAMYKDGDYVKPYLSCYAKKHSIDAGEVKGDGFFGQSDFSNAAEARNNLQPNQPKLAELDGIFKSKLANTPNTFLYYKDNPAVIAEIAAQRGEYLNCVVAEADDKPDPRLSLFLDDIGKAQAEVDRYTPADFLYLVSAGANSEELLYAVSPKARAEFTKKVLKNEDSRKEFNAAWDKLAAAVAKKIPQYKPSADRFKFRYPAGEKLLMDYFKTPSTLKILRIGTDTTGWDIQKDSGNFPSYRYKDVSVYLRDSTDDFPYCKVVTARVKQDYAGGGTYNAKIYRSSASEEIVGCP